MSQIEWSPAANKTKLAIVRGLMGANLQAALRLTVVIETKISRLTKFPELGRPGRLTGTRELVIGRTKYIAVYKISGAGRITILRLLHSAQRWPK